MLPADAIPMATVRSVNASKRELRLQPMLDAPQLDYLCDVGLDWLWIQGPALPRAKRCRVEQARLLRDDLVVQLVAGVSRDAVGNMRGCQVYLEPTPDYQQLRHLTDQADWTGMTVRHRNGDTLGQVTALWDSPAHPIITIADATGRQVLLPCIDETILDVDEAQQTITVVDDITPYALMNP